MYPRLKRRAIPSRLRGLVRRRRNLSLRAAVSGDHLGSARRRLCVPNEAEWADMIVGSFYGISSQILHCLQYFHRADPKVAIMHSNPPTTPSPGARTPRTEGSQVARHKLVFTISHLAGAPVTRMSRVGLRCCFSFGHHFQEKTQLEGDRSR